VNLTGGGVGKIAFALKCPFDELLLVVDLANGDDPESAHVGAHNQGLGVGVADHADPETAMEAGQFRFELGAEIAVFDIVDGPLDACAVAHSHAAAPCSQVGMVVRTVVKVRNAVRCRCNPKQSAHFVLLFWSLWPKNGFLSTERFPREDEKSEVK
jgi:hypothetical protein